MGGSGAGIGTRARGGAGGILTRRLQGLEGEGLLEAAAPELEIGGGGGWRCRARVRARVRTPRADWWGISSSAGLDFFMYFPISSALGRDLTPARGEGRLM